MLLETLNITNNALEDINGGSGMISYLMDILHMFLCKNDNNSILNKIFTVLTQRKLHSANHNILLRDPAGNYNITITLQHQSLKKVIFIHERRYT